MIFRGKRSGIIPNFTMNVDPGYKYIKKLIAGLNWYMLEIKDFTSSVNLKLENENRALVSFIGQPVKIRLSNREI